MGEDPNARARRQLAADQVSAAIRNQVAAFAGDFAMGKVGPVDRFGRRIQVHDLVLWEPPYTMVYEVTKIEPVLTADPNQPVGRVQITLELTAPMVTLANRPAMVVTVVGHTRSTTDAELHRIEGAEKGNPLPEAEAEAPGAPATPAEGDGSPAAPNAPDAPPTEDPTS